MKRLKLRFAYFIMRPRKYLINLIYLIICEFLVKCYALELPQSGLCSLETASVVPNICDRSNHLVHVSESVSGCSTAGNKCWCILIDNRNRIYDGAMVIELVQNINRNKWTPPAGIQYGEVKSYLSFNIIAGLNRVLVQPYSPPEAITVITSIKIRNNEVCRFTNTTPMVSDYQQPTTNYNRFLPPGDFSNGEYRNFADCMNRNYYTENSARYCPNYRPEFMIEKRSFNNRIYWCININNDQYLLTTANQLHIAYTPRGRSFVYSPLDAYTEREIPGSDFHLGNRRTIIAVSEYNNELADLISITINNHPICSYFDPPIITTQPPPLLTIPTAPLEAAQEMLPEIQLRSSLPATLFIPPDQSIKNSNPDLVEYPAIVPELNQPNNRKPVSVRKTCGLKQNKKNSLIAFGLTTSPGDWPWHAAIYKVQTRKTNRNFICGGTLVDRKTIVTAAHCVLENINLVITPERLTVELGRHDLMHASVATQEYRVFEVKPHEAYNPVTYENDIAILILANYVQVTQYVNFVCLPKPNVKLQSQVGTAVGWGLDQNNKMQTELKEANLPVVEQITCLTSNREFFRQYLSSTNFCAGSKNKTTVCRGDSGGGLVFKSKNHWFLGGITSLGVLSKSGDSECDLVQYALFTDVSKFITWIKGNS